MLPLSMPCAAAAFSAVRGCMSVSYTHSASCGSKSTSPGSLGGGGGQDAVRSTPSQSIRASTDEMTRCPSILYDANFSVRCTLQCGVPVQLARPESALSNEFTFAASGPVALITGNTKYSRADLTMGQSLPSGSGVNGGVAGYGSFGGEGGSEGGGVTGGGI